MHRCRHRRRRRRRRRRQARRIFGKTMVATAAAAAGRSRIALIVQIKNYSTPHHHPFLFPFDPSPSRALGVVRSFLWR